MKKYSALVVVWGALAASACNLNYLGDDCRNSLTCPHPDGGAGGGVPVDCIPGDKMDGPVAESCGLFVSNADIFKKTTVIGTKDNPHTSIADAVAALVASPSTSQRLYLCGGDYDEAVALPAGVSLYGGLDCADSAAPWRYDATKRANINAAADEVGLTIVGSESSSIEDVNVTATTATAPGGSSIAVLVDGAVVTATRCDFVAGEGATGADGEQPAGNGVGGVTGGGGMWSDNMMCDSNTLAIYGGGPGAVPNACPGGGVPDDGGIGGPGNPGTQGGPGADGPNGGGDGGKGQDTTACAPGEAPTAPGTVGPPGAGATGLGALTDNGYTPIDGGEGQPGLPGKGGGGGGGALSCGMMKAGPSGGGGGSGACGGNGGPGGKGGGGSFALMSLGATVSMEACTLRTGNGGKGGTGAVGQAGGVGGAGGLGLIGGAGTSCDGGIGGDGGMGGPGGGGLGGHSLGVAYIGSVPTLMNGSLVVTGDFGAGGPSSGNPGSAGVKADTQSFE